MSIAKVRVRDENTLELCEDAKKGDLINLKELQTVDTSRLLEILQQEKDKIMQKKVDEVLRLAQIENEKNIVVIKKDLEQKNYILEEKIKSFELHKNQALKLQEIELDKKSIMEQQKVERQLKEEIEKIKLENLRSLGLKDKQLDELQKKIDLIDLNTSAKFSEEKNKIITDYEKKQSILEIELKNLKENIDVKIASAIKEKELLDEVEKQKEIIQIRSQYDQEIRNKESVISELTFQKSVKNVKQTGEDLEGWCNEQVLSYMQNGLQNCTWNKDNEVIRDDDEQKGSKADFIFKIYANEKHNENEILSSVCLDMKDENPSSLNKKSNADYYKQLDKNRIKKGCKYAVLVSNLELDKSYILPIFKVNEFEDMYVVRPSYMIVFLNMIVSLANIYGNLVLKDAEERLEMKEALDLQSEFESLKLTYLDKPLESLKTDVQSIQDNSQAIKNASNKIDATCDKIVDKYIHNIETKLEKFNIKKLSKEINNL